MNMEEIKENFQNLSLKSVWMSLFQTQRSILIFVSNRYVQIWNVNTRRQGKLTEKRKALSASGGKLYTYKQTEFGAFTLSFRTCSISSFSSLNSTVLQCWEGCGGGLNRQKPLLMLSLHCWFASYDFMRLNVPIICKCYVRLTS
jgi:hypothetical protein